MSMSVVFMSRPLNAWTTRQPADICADATETESHASLMPGLNLRFIHGSRTAAPYAFIDNADQ